MQSEPAPPAEAAAPPPTEEPEPPPAAVVAAGGTGSGDPRAAGAARGARVSRPDAGRDAGRQDPPSTSDLELYKKAEVKIEGPAAASATQNFSPQRVTAGEHEYVGEPITMSLRDADLVEILRSFAQISGLNIVIQPGVGGSVTVQLEDVPWDQALEQILKINGLGYELEGNIMRIAPTSTLRTEAQERQQLEAARALSVPLQTVIKRLSYSSARSVATLLQGRGGVLSRSAGR